MSDKANGTGARTDAFDEGRKAGREEAIEEISATKALISFTELAALKKCEEVCRKHYDTSVIARGAIKDLDKARGK